MREIVNWPFISGSSWRRSLVAFVCSSLVFLLPKPEGESDELAVVTRFIFVSVIVSFICRILFV